MRTTLSIAALIVGIVSSAGAQTGIEHLRTASGELERQIVERAGERTELASLIERIGELTERQAELVRQGEQSIEDTREIERIEAQIAVLRDQAAAREKAIAELQDRYTEMVQRIESFARQQSADLQRQREAEELRQRLERQASGLVAVSIGQFVGTLRAWKDLGLMINGTAETARGLLLFPTTASGDVVTTLLTGLKYAGLATSIAGLLVEEAKPHTSGSSVAILGITVAGITDLFGRSHEAQVIVENVARNQQFTDDVIAFSRVTQPFADKAKSLYDQLPGSVKGDPASFDLTWRPTDEQLAQFHALIAVRKDMSAMVRQMKGTAESILDRFTVTDEGRERMNRIIGAFTAALSSWEAEESTYLSLHAFLKKPATL